MSVGISAAQERFSGSVEPTEGATPEAVSIARGVLKDAAARAGSPKAITADPESA